MLPFINNEVHSRTGRSASARAKWIFRPKISVLFATSPSKPGTLTRSLLPSPTTGWQATTSFTRALWRPAKAPASPIWVIFAVAWFLFAVTNSKNPSLLALSAQAPSPINARGLGVWITVIEPHDDDLGRTPAIRASSRRAGGGPGSSGAQPRGAAGSRAPSIAVRGFAGASATVP
jgi:hypothetical protein